MNTTVEMPAVTEMRRQLMRQNIRQLQGDIKADTVMKRSRSFFRFGMADWSVLANQRNPGE